MGHFNEMVFIIANLSPPILISSILLISLAGGASTFFLKKERKLFWSLFVITFANLFFGFFFLISVSATIGLILSFILIAIVIYSSLKSKSGVRLN